MELSLEVVGFILWLLTIFMIFGRKHINILVGSILHIYVATFLFDSYAIFSFGEFIVTSYVISTLGICYFILNMVKKI